MKRIKYIICAIAVIVFGLLAFVACNNGNGSDNGNEGDNEAKIVSVADGVINGDKISIETGTSVDALDLSKVIEPATGATFSVFEDEEGKLSIPDKQVRLSDGDNEFFVKVTKGNQSKTYTLNIWKNFYATVSYYVEGVLFDSQTNVLSHTHLTDFRAPENLNYGIKFVSWHCDGYYVETPSIRFDAEVVYEEYLLKLNPDGGVCSFEYALVERGKFFQLPVPTKENYTFAGWFYDGNRITNKDGKGIGLWNIADDVELTAGWSGDFIDIEMKTDGTGAGSLNNGGVKELQLGSVHTVTAVTNKLGYVFDGWYVDQILVCAEMEFTFTVDKDTRTYTAKWKVADVLENFEFTSTSNSCTITGVKDKSVETLTIPDFVMQINNGAFDNCNSVRTVTTSMKHFSYVPKSNLRTVVLRDGESITGKMFERCYYLESIHIPSSVTAIDEEAFVRLSNLQTIGVADDNSVFASQDGILYNKKKTLIMFIPNAVSGEIVIPEGVDEIPAKAFMNNSQITGVELPDSLLRICYDAFYGCSNLSTVKLPNNVKFIESGVLQNTAWYDNCSDGLIYIGKVAYKYKGVMPSATAISIKEGTFGIAPYAFENCKGLKSLVIPDSLVDIGEEAFNGCNGIEELSTPAFAMSDVPHSSLKTVSVTSGDIIDDYAFDGASALTEVSLVDGIKTIGNGAFGDCSSLKNISIPRSVTKIGNSAFYGCTSLEHIEVETGNSYYCDFEDMLFNASKTELIFVAPKLKTEIIVPSTVKRIARSALGGCNNLVSLTIPFVGATSSGEETYLAYFFGAYGYSGNEDCVPQSLKNVEITGSTSIGENAFRNCNSIENVKLPQTLTRIERNAFSGCASLVSIDIPETLGFVGEFAFFGCEGLQRVNITDLSKWCKISFEYRVGYYDHSSSNPLVFAHNLYLNDELVTDLIIPETVKYIYSNAFNGCTSLTSVTIHEGLTGIGDYAFEYCNGLNAVYIDNLAAWCDIYFSNNMSNPLSYARNLYLNNQLITDFVVPDDVSRIRDYAFYNCGHLTSVTISDKLGAIGTDAFYHCDTLTAVNVNSISKWLNVYFASCYANPLAYAHKLYVGGELFTDLAIDDDTLEGINDYAFYGCSDLKSVTMTYCVKKIGKGAFAYCSELESVTIGVKVTEIGDSAFLYCVGLKSIVIPIKVDKIGYGAFRQCSNMETIYCEADSKPFGWQSGGGSFWGKYDWNEECPARVVWGYVKEN